MMSTKLLSAVVIAGALTMASYPVAAEITSALKSACKRDYKRFCGVYGVNDPGLRKMHGQSRAQPVPGVR
jgi:hypothetical protein